MRVDEQPPLKEPIISQPEPINPNTQHNQSRIMNPNKYHKFIDLIDRRSDKIHLIDKIRIFLLQILLNNSKREFQVRWINHP
jgi:hypothetical protein